MNLEVGVNNRARGNVNMPKGNKLYDLGKSRQLQGIVKITNGVTASLPPCLKCQDHTNKKINLP